MKAANIEDLLGRTIIAIEKDIDSSYVKIYCSGGKYYQFMHHQDCCESVNLVDGYDDLNNLVNDGPVLLAECTTNDEGEAPGGESHLWTFYKLSTNGASCTMRWLGESNGYYSMSVDIDEGDHNLPDPVKYDTTESRFSKLS